MKTQILTRITMMTLFAVVAVVVRVATLTLHAQERLEHPGKKTRYIVKDLGTLGGTGSVAEGITDSERVVGSANLPGDKSGHAYLWRDNVMTDLGTLGGPNSSEQWPVRDNRGLIVGAAETSQADPFGENFCSFGTGLICRGFLWRDGHMVPLATLGGNNSYAAGINSRGQAVGWAENSTKDPTCVPPQVLDFAAVIWRPQPDQIQQLPPLSGDTITAATGINDREQVIGVSGPCSAATSHGVIWEDRKVTDLGNLGGVLNTVPWAINSHGQVAGQSDLPGDTTLHAFLWTQEEGMRDLGTLAGDSASLAFGINEKGQLVGGSCVDATFTTCRGFLWEDGVMIDLNALVKPGSKLQPFFGNDINSRGEIALYAFEISGQFRAALAIPCDEGHESDIGCEDNSEAVTDVTDTADRHFQAVPENVREILRKRLPLARLLP